MMTRKVGICGCFEAENTKNVAVRQRKNHKNGTWSQVAGGGAGGSGGFLEKFVVEFGWRVGGGGGGREA